ncbi:NAD-dependent epimerase/dehydratase family protein [Solimicrobium silvestre]|uniref:NADH(P)-binding n=1 Tax=Solimicrobium silvestre TaxID=2099400 RepID=A0A2S9H4V4_9BURK|nr:NAD-dependent epimerase/dehydratase family protein [Solimicrobium silvestre]PRC95012.1 NADH(P)-binding [Solimicrobium silvestre]
MSKNILIIGGTRFFGKVLVQKLLDAGNQVTIATRGQMKDSFDYSVQRIKVDRKNEASMLEAFAGISGFDIVYDQMCYTPRDAAISVKTFAGKVGRYVVSSTIEVYDHLYRKFDRPYREVDLDLNSVAVDMTHPWDIAELAEQHYGLGKRQAEAYFYQEGSLPVVSVRIAHVLAGPEDFTGRLAAYVQRVYQGDPVLYSNGHGKSSFTNPEAICDFLCWVGEETFLGPINSASVGEFSALDIYREVGELMHKDIVSQPVVCQINAPQLSPFDYSHLHMMDTSRAQSLGYSFNHRREWLAELISQHIAAESKAAQI